MLTNLPIFPFLHSLPPVHFLTKKISFSILDKNNNELKVSSKVGENLLEVCKENNVKIDGACEGNCACATCHVILSKKLYDKITPPSAEEEDTLDQASDLTETSRLACQLYVDERFEGEKIKLPKKQRNLL